MGDRLKFFLNRISERLWVKPLAMCLLSIAAAFLAKTADNTDIGQFVPEITPDSIETLLTIISASMLVIATFAVASMVSAYASASTTATPRSFPLVISDDVSQNALSTFIGAFIFSIVALIALQNGFYDKAGRFGLFALTLVVFAMVILTFVRWVDRIARLGRLGGTIDKVETATAAALQQRRCAPTLGGVPAGPRQDGDRAIYGRTIGYVQRVDVTALQTYAEKYGGRITVAALPGTFVAPGRVLAYVTADSGVLTDIDTSQIAQAFLIGDDRIFDEDPRFGLIVLSEIASRALSPAVNDPGTAIDIIGTLVRLFAGWSEPLKESDTRPCECDRVEVPEISLRDMFDDAFTAIARDGAGTIEVAGRLQKAFESLASIEHAMMRSVARYHAGLALARAEKALDLPEDLDVVRKLAKFANLG
ncbi:MAG: DUF2254 domain-containing protein [Nitrospirota bacterium]|nr:DUF2254 domain-containing protein [Nitrospirota bacterium]